jgi:spore coat protein U-like protein
MSIKSRPAVVGAMFLAASVACADAATTTSTFTSQITITASCTINSASTLNFSSQGVLSANVDQTSTVQVQCTNTTPYNIGLDAGTATGATVTTRKMTNGSATVSYALYSDSGRATNWGNTVGTDTVSSTGTGAAQSFTVYGRVPAQVTPAPATYADTITVTVSY